MKFFRIYSLIFTWIVRSIFFLMKIQIFPISTGKSFEQKIYFCPLKIKSIFFKEENTIFSIKLE